MTANRPAPEGTRLGELWRILPEESTVSADGVLEIGGVAVTELAERFGTPCTSTTRLGCAARSPASSRDYAGAGRTPRCCSPQSRCPRSACTGSPTRKGSRSTSRAAVSCVSRSLGASTRHASTSTATPRPTPSCAWRSRPASARSSSTTTTSSTRSSGSYSASSPASRRRRTPRRRPADRTRSSVRPPIDQAARAIARMQAHPLMEFEGVHLHIGSQILDVAQFGEAVEKISSVGTFGTYDVGGGLAYTYDEVVAGGRRRRPRSAEQRLRVHHCLVAKRRRVVPRRSCSHATVRIVRSAARGSLRGMEHKTMSTEALWV